MNWEKYCAVYGVRIHRKAGSSVSRSTAQPLVSQSILPILVAVVRWGIARSESWARRKLPVRNVVAIGLQ